MRRRVLSRGNRRGQSARGFFLNLTCYRESAEHAPENDATRTHERARLAGGNFLCCSASAASGFCRTFPFDVSRSLAQTAALAPSGRNGGFSRRSSSCTCSARPAAHRDGSNRLLPGNRTPRRSIDAICNQLRSGTASCAKHVRKAIQPIWDLPARAPKSFGRNIGFRFPSIAENADSHCTGFVQTKELDAARANALHPFVLNSFVLRKIA